MNLTTIFSILSVVLTSLTEPHPNDTGFTLLSLEALFSLPPSLPSPLVLRMRETVVTLENLSSTVKNLYLEGSYPSLDLVERDVRLLDNLDTTTLSAKQVSLDVEASLVHLKAALPLYVPLFCERD